MAKIGILALQGAFIEHQQQFDALGAETVQVRLPEHLEGLDGLVIPGGESTTIGKLATEYKLIDPLRKFASKKPTWGTCAGMIFLAKDIGIDSQPILGLMDISVNRNAFGRQVDSFETDLTIAGIQSEDVPFHAVFIRAPLVTEVTDDVTVLAQLDNEKIVAVEQGHLLATAFHPELTDDNRIHAYFYDMVTKEID
ncbi:MAG: pyridoxal 5'-phosphate synthase glutaminase subunit PdxT [Chloroflexota bacterium]